VGWLLPLQNPTCVATHDAFGGTDLVSDLGLPDCTRRGGFLRNACQVPPLRTRQELRPDVLTASAVHFVNALKQETTTIPIVMISGVLFDGVETLVMTVQALVDATEQPELRSIRTDLDDLREKVDNILGYRKEIDHALERVAAIERQLGIDRRIS